MLNVNTIIVIAHRQIELQLVRINWMDMRIGKLTNAHGGVDRRLGVSAATRFLLTASNHTTHIDQF